MGIFESVILGLVQGLTEFLPVSSSGHLIIAREVLAIEVAGGLAFDAVLQLATALAVLVYFRADFVALLRDFLAWVRGHAIPKAQKVLIIALILGTIPAVVAGLLLEPVMETTFRSATLVAWMLIAGSALFVLAEFVSKRMERRELSVHSGIVIGFFQCLALIPGVSRSGATISGGLLFGLTRPEAARFGFLLSFPIIFGSGMKKVIELMQNGTFDAQALPIMLGFVTAFLVGIGAIRFLMQFLKTYTLLPFVMYRLVLASAILVFL